MTYGTHVARSDPSRRLHNNAMNNLCTMRRAICGQSTNARIAHGNWSIIFFDKGYSLTGAGYLARVNPCRSFYTVRNASIVCKTSREKSKTRWIDGIGGRQVWWPVVLEDETLTFSSPRRWLESSFGGLKSTYGGPRN